MSKSFLIILVLCLFALGIFIYFVFGFNQKPSDINTHSQSTLPSPTTQTNPTTQTIPSDLKIEDITVGTGPEVKNGDTVVINYTGTLTDGTKFDSSYDRNEPFETQIGVGRVIKGWDLGVVGMKVGGKRRLTIPPTLGYGDQAAGTIPPNSTLIFEVELVGIK